MKMWPFSLLEKMIPTPEPLPPMSPALRARADLLARPVKSEYGADPKTCNHQGKFTAYGWNSIGWVTCLDCGAPVGMDDAFNVMAKRMDEATDKALAAAEGYAETAYMRKKRAKT